MAVRIRLRRVGRKKQASYRVVVADKDAPRDGAYVEALGFYNPRRQPAELRLDMEKVEAWLAKGAAPSDTVAALIRKARKGGDSTIGLYSAEEVAATRKAEQLGAAAAAEPAKPRRGAKKAEAAAAEAPAAEAAEPTPETEAKADPEVMAEAHAQTDEPTAEPTSEAPETVEAPEASTGEAEAATAVETAPAEGEEKPAKTSAKKSAKKEAAAEE